VNESELALLSAKIDRAFAQAEALKYGDHQQVLALAKSASRDAEALGDFQRYARALTYQAWAYGNLNQFEAALIAALEVLRLARTYDFVEVEARIVGVLSMVFYLCGMKDEAVFLFQHQLELGESLRNHEFQGMALNDLGVVKMSAGEWQAAIAYLQRSLVFMPQHMHDGIDYSLVHLNLAFACINVQRFDEAFEHAQQVLVLTPHAPKAVCDAHLWLAWVYISRDEVDRAADHIAQARAVIQAELPDWYNDNVDRLSAELLLHEKRHAEAIQVLEYMVSMTLERGELDYAVSGLQKLKEVYEQVGDTDGIIRTYKRLVEDIPRLQKANSDLRFTVLRMVFAFDRSALQAKLQLEQQKKHILERLSHEFRTPLAIIQNSAELSEKRGELETLEQRQQRLLRITEQVHWLTVMLEDIQNLLRLDENENLQQLRPSAVQLYDLMQSTVHELARYHAPTARVQFQVGTERIKFNGDRRSLEMIAVQLILNALKFSDDEVAVAYSVEGSRLVMTIADRGIGIAEEEQTAIFTPLVRGSNLQKQEPGLGVGLALVNKLVQRLRGTIQLHSALNEGTTVVVSVPLQH
jgi:signal transduction histidine kinase